MNGLVIIIVVAILLIIGSDIYMKSLKKKIMRERFKMTKFFQLVIEDDKINDTNEQGHTPLMVAVLGKFDKSTIKLLDAGTDINIKGETGEQVVHLAAHHSKPVILENIIEKGADVNNRDMQGCTAIWYAAQNSRYDNAEILLKHDAMINVVDNNFGLTPLMIAAQNGGYRTVEVLLKNNPDKTISVENFGTAYDIAKLRLRDNIKNNKKAAKELEKMVEKLKI
jgi:ankyrin repeat protein